MKVEFENEEEARELHNKLISMCDKCQRGIGCEQCPSLIITLKSEGYMKQTELEKTKDEYYKIFASFSDACTVVPPVSNYVHELEKEIKRLSDFFVKEK